MFVRKRYYCYPNSQISVIKGLSPNQSRSSVVFNTFQNANWQFIPPEGSPLNKISSKPFQEVIEALVSDAKAKGVNLPDWFLKEEGFYHTRIHVRETVIAVKLDYYDDRECRIVVERVSFQFERTITSFTGAMKSAKGVIKAYEAMNNAIKRQAKLIAELREE